MRSGTAGQTGGRRKRQSDCRESGELGIKLGIKRRLLIPSPAASADKRSSSGPVRLPEPALQTLCKPGVAGSNPVSSTLKLKGPAQSDFRATLLSPVAVLAIIRGNPAIPGVSPSSGEKGEDGGRSHAATGRQLVASPHVHRPRQRRSQTLRKQDRARHEAAGRGRACRLRHRN